LKGWQAADLPPFGVGLISLSAIMRISSLINTYAITNPINPKLDLLGAFHNQMLETLSLPYELTVKMINFQLGFIFRH
jgi:hypothetical protein